MPYGFDEKTQTSGGGSYLDEAGIYDARISSVSYENSKNDGSGKMVLVFKFETNDGKSFRHIEWDIDEAKLTTNHQGYYRNDASQGNAPRDKQNNIIPEVVYVRSKIDKEYEDQGARVKHMLNAYGGGQGSISATSYEDYAKKVVAEFNKLDRSEYKPLLIVYNTKDYASLPKWAPFFGVDKSNLEAKATKQKMNKVAKPEATQDEDSGEF